jgi:nicotinate-nucleotide adenylyltransferase
MRIAIFGGTFNPIHKGHIFLANQAKKSLELDKVVFVPAYIPPHKKSDGIISSDKRFSMIRLAVWGKPYFEVSRYEIDRKERVYSVETVKHFKSVLPKGTELFFLIGADSLKGLDKWRDSKKLFNLCEFVVFSRPGFNLGRKTQGIRAVKIDALDVSSTQVRELIKQGKSISGLVPKPVAAYIMRKHLYRA